MYNCDRYSPVGWIRRELLARKIDSSFLKRYGNTYGRYMNTPPRWIGIPKSEGK